MADKFQRSMKWPGLDDTYYFLPLVSKDDNGKVMTVKNGEWAAGDEQVSFDTEASGETIILDDAADRPLRGLRVFGQTTQKTLTGKNLLNINTEGRTYSGVTFTANADGSVTCVGTSSADNAFANLNYVDMNTLSIPPGTYIVSGAKDGVAVVLVVDGKAVLWQVTGERTVTIPETAVNSWMRVIVDAAGTTVNTTIYPMIRRVEIADSTWEPYTGGIPSPDPDYPQPLNSVGDDGAIDVTVAGKNLFNSAWAQGMVGSESGTQTDNSVTICTADYISVSPNAVYTMKRTIATDFINVRAYDAGKKFVGTGYEAITFVRGEKNGTAGNPMGAGSSWATFQVGDGIHYLKFNDRSNDLSTQYMMVLGEEVPATYEPYKGQTLTLATPNGLPSVGDVCDEVDLERGVYVQRVQKMQLTSTMGVGWHAAVNGKRIYTEIKTLWKEIGSPILCTHAIKGEWASDAEGTICLGNKNVGAVGFSTADFATVDEVKAFLDANAVYIVAPLITPIETPLSAEEIAAYKALTTHYPTTTIYNDESAEMEVEYVNKNNFDADAVLFRKQTLTDTQKAQILDNIGASSRLQVHDVSVTTSLWVDSALHADYPYQALIPVNGATSEMYPDVVFDVTEALSGNYAPVADAANGGVLIYAKVVPEADIVVPTVTLWK